MSEDARALTFFDAMSCFFLRSCGLREPSRTRCLTDGAGLGARNFVNEAFAVRREHFGPRRTGSTWGALLRQYPDCRIQSRTAMERSTPTRERLGLGRSVAPMLLSSLSVLGSLRLRSRVGRAFWEQSKAEPQ